MTMDETDIDGGLNYPLENPEEPDNNCWLYTRRLSVQKKHYRDGA